MDRVVLVANQGWTVTMLVICLFLFKEWWPSVRSGIDRIIEGHWPASSCWLVFGIFFMTVSNFGDNLYWLITWSTVYLDMPISEWLMAKGVYANSVLRQGLGIFALALHLLAVKSQSDTNHIESVAAFRSTRRVIMISLGLGALATGLLICMGGPPFMRFST